MSELLQHFPRLLPLAITWAERESQMVVQAGAPLTPELEALARRVGVQEPGRIRLVAVEEFRVPEHPELRAAATQLGMFGPHLGGLTLGYAVILRRGHHTTGTLLAHEFRHVAQYEASGSIASFLAIHLRHLLLLGYEDSPFEVDARAHEFHAG